MQNYKLIIKDFFKVALWLWLILVLLEILFPGAINRFLNLELYFYSLVIFFIILRFVV
ncbi:MAG: hypothetical protein UR94_C0033G0018 [Parcubacteria group bacterium GW2011_GWA2_36_10]|nr:MAG: hypothetical protein UR94_C0033G0018 [Parcubacteria group bacterium GW2011_GWA2_36_10]